MNHGSFAELAFEQKMSGQELLPEEPTSPVIPSSRSKFAMLKTRVEILEKGMGELRDKWIQDIEEHLGRDTNVEPMEMEGTLNIQEFNSMELLQDARKMNKMREELSLEVKMLKDDIMVELKEDLKVQLKQEIMEDLKVEIKESLSKEIGSEKEILRKMKMCFLADTMPAKSTQINDGELPDNQNDSDSEESVSLLAKYRNS